jgi:hypothetical protein
MTTKKHEGGGMTHGERRFLVDDFLGGSGGYLGYFSYSTHETFYHRYCGLDDVDVIEVRNTQGTTKRTYEAILREASPADQAKIIRGTIAFAKDRPYGDLVENAELEAKLLAIASGLEVGGHVLSPHLASTTETVRMALDNADVLLKERGPVAAVDRAHTALHGHLKKICADRNIVPTKSDPDIMEIFSSLREQCPEMKAVAHDEHAKKLFRALGSALDSLNFIRNRGTLSHPNELLLDEHEAALYINLSRAVLRYLDSKLAKQS